MAVDKKATLTYVQLMKEDLAVLRLVPEDGIIPDYEAGQFITVGMPIPSENNKVVRRAYSMASHHENKKFIELVVRWVWRPLPGRVTTALFNYGEGDEVSWIPPTGVALKINEKMGDGTKDDRRIESLADYGKNIGIAYQIRDDLLDWQNEDKLFNILIKKSSVLEMFLMIWKNCLKNIRTELSIALGK